MFISTLICSFSMQVAFVTKSIESIASALSQCLSKWRRLGSSQRKATSPLLQMVCCSTLQLAHSLSRTLQRMNLSEKVYGIKYHLHVHYMYTTWHAFMWWYLSIILFLLKHGDTGNYSDLFAQ